jgi:phosphocarrier protein HPr
MAEQTVTIRNDVGLHARPAAVFAKKAAEYRADVRVATDAGEANAKSLLSVLKLDVRSGDTFRLRAEGDDADEAVAALAALVEGMA